MPYIKSHSNYVLQQKHQNIKDGTVFERDITTIGAVDNFSPGQTPIYRSGNFLITVRGDARASNQYNTEKWKENAASGTVWTLQSISGLTSDREENNDTKIVLKQDYYDLNDFAYYGSLTELFRASITDIIDRFPGELYATSGTNVYYTSSSYTEDRERIETIEVLGDTGKTLVDNPFGIDIYGFKVPDDTKNRLKYFAENGWNNYEVIKNGEAKNITSWSSINYYFTTTSNKHKYICYTATTSSITSAITETPYPCKGDKMADVTIEASGDSYNIGVWIGDDNAIYYLTESSDIHIRPKKEFLDNFYDNCDSFQKLLMNQDTNYEATFAVIRENEYGYYRELVPFKFPKGQGGYNIDASDYGFNAYTEQMVKIGEYYDENFSDNLWRSMTHEAIKNFDWTYTREYQDGDEEEYVLGGQRIQKALRVFGREFDEILSYINNIRNLNRVTYDERSNIPDYFLTDVVENEGWDVKLIYPYNLTEKKEDGTVNNDYQEGGTSSECNGQLDNTDSSSNLIVREFSQDANATVVPYRKSMLDDKADGYFISCNSGDIWKSLPCGGIYNYAPTSASTFSGKTTWYDKDALGDNGVIKNRIKSYTSEVAWTNQESNNEFLRRLKINSPYIWRNKGTIEGIEMILGMFGLKSKRWLDAKQNQAFPCEYSNKKYDFDVTEYTSFTNRIEEEWDAVHQDYRINWYNSTKNISYDNRSVSNYNKTSIWNAYIPYQGLPIAYRDEYTSKGDAAYISAKTTNEIYIDSNNKKVLKRYLYPNFNPSEELDGNLYFQMNGGWLSKIIVNGNKKYNFQYDVDNNIVYTNYSNSAETLYKETVRNIRREDDINGLLSIPTNELYNGIICNVTNVEKNSAIIDGVIYPIQNEWYNNKVVSYISLVKSEGFIKVGLDKFFDTSIVCYDIDYKVTHYDVDNLPNGYELKAYIKKTTVNGKTISDFILKEFEGNSYSISNFALTDEEWDDNSYTNYFVLDDVNYASDIAVFNSNINDYTSGWKRLTKNSSEYIKLNTIVNYCKGNNPHNGNMVYDNGHEYFTYFKRIFKHAIDNELFNESCYEGEQDLEYMLSQYGFSGLIDSNEDVKNYDEYLSADTKIHYFGNYKKKNNSNKINQIFIYGEDSDRLNGFKTVYKEETTNVKNYILKDTHANGWIERINPYSRHSKADEVTNQIMNNKRLLINFNLHYVWYTQRGQEEIKYLDDIVMNYLSQMIPSSTILQIQYTSK